jgi:hypothetical protein
MAPSEIYIDCCEEFSVSNCSQSLSAEALLRSVHEIAERLAELHDLRRQVRKAEVRARAANHSRASKEGLL